MKHSPNRNSLFGSLGARGTLQSALIFVLSLGLSYLLPRLFGELNTDKTRPTCQLQWGETLVKGYLGPNNVCRYSIQYSKTERWENPRSTVT